MRDRRVDLMPNITAQRCGVVPIPPDAKLIVPGFALLSAMNSASVLAGTFGLTTSTFGRLATSVTPTRSRRRLKFRLG